MTSSHNISFFSPFINIIILTSTNSYFSTIITIARIKNSNKTYCPISSSNIETINNTSGIRIQIIISFLSNKQLILFIIIIFF